MASSISSTALVPINAVALRPAPARPVDAGVPTALDPEALRQSQAQAETLRQQDRAQSERPDTDAQQRQAFTGDSAPFVAQLLSQDQATSKPPSFADAARAYSRFQEEPQSGFVLDQPARVDVKI